MNRARSRLGSPSLTVDAQRLSGPADRGRRGIVDGLRAGHRRTQGQGCRSKRHDRLRRAQVRMPPVCGSGQAEATTLTTVRRPTPYLRSSARPDSPARASRRIATPAVKCRQHRPHDRVRCGHHRPTTAVTSDRQSHLGLTVPAVGRVVPGIGHDDDGRIPCASGRRR